MKVSSHALTSLLVTKCDFCHIYGKCDEIGDEINLCH